MQKKIEYNNYLSQQRDKISNDQAIYPPGTCVIIGDSIFSGLIEENISKQHNVRISKFPGAIVNDISYHVYLILRKKPKHIFSTLTIRSDNGKTALTGRNLCDHLLDLTFII